MAKRNDPQILCDKCQRPFLEAFLYLRGVKNKEGKETWPVCRECIPKVMEGYRKWLEGKK